MNSLVFREINIFGGYEDFCGHFGRSPLKSAIFVVDFILFLQSTLLRVFIKVKVQNANTFWVAAKMSNIFMGVICLFKK